MSNPIVTKLTSHTYDPSKLNVFSGPNSLIDYFNPDKNAPLPLVELPPKLNPYHADGVRIYAKMLTALPATNVKSLPALSLLENGGVISLDSTADERACQPIHTVTESSSGSTVTSMAMIARQHGVSKVRAWMSNKVSPTKSSLMRFFGLELALFGGPSQSPPADPMGGIAKAAAQGREQGVYNPNQYENTANPAAHERWTGKQLLEQLPEINVFAGGMGTGGTITGTAKRLKQDGNGVHVIGVCVARGDKIPGPRPRELLEPVDFPWKSLVDDVEDVASRESYTLSMQLCRYGIVCGPSSGFSLQGLFQVLERRKRQGTLQKLRQQNDGKPIQAVFLCCDLPFQYVDEYFTKCDSKEFLPIVNEHLFKVDQYAYSTSWILDVASAQTMLVYPRFPTSDVGHSGRVDLASPSELGSDPSESGSDTSAPASPGLLRPAILDLRSRTDFASGHLAHARNVPISSLRSDDPSPYQDAVLLATQFTELNKRFVQVPKVQHTCPGNGVAELNRLSVEEMLSCLKSSGREVLVVDYTGETARLAVSVLRHAGVKAYSVIAGWQGLVEAGVQMVKSQA
ncbi:related to CYS4 - Cystathionine beta-synthase [Melanopsichium pennsylvanicum]|uniref:Related to CYS4 - Cystathionine beta-synthase n=2 Tax=Melanopsichium pennsylvanicum TaxID=63383 RepID=A0AAJ5C5E3_9BASI|nr:cysteine synthase k m:cysteine synthase b [Melanopsichium pennsylvanicum 4]SNX84478.1 related to CYS4 - Cystathionine beta-synthase [Melanopsichium pennsylvanicum]